MRSVYLLIVYLLYHIYEYGDENEYEEMKILGIYSSEANANAAIQYYKDLRGFSKYPLSCFIIESYRVDTNAGWRGGFCNACDIHADFDKLAQCFIEWTEGRYTLFEDVYNSPLLIEVYSLLRGEPKILADKLSDVWNGYFPHIKYERDDFLRLADKIITAMLSKMDRNKIDRCAGTVQMVLSTEPILNNAGKFFCLCKSGSAEQVRDAFNAELDINAKDSDGRTALMWAAQYNTDPEVIKVLLDAGADIIAKDGEGKTALMWAAKWNSDRIVNTLFDAGADIHALDNGAKMAADYAQENERIESTATLRRLWGTTC